MTEKTTKNHPLEDLLEIEPGSTPLPTVSHNPFMDEDTEELEIDEDEFYKKDVDTSIDDVMKNAPVVPEFYDQIDKKNDQKFQEIYNAAMEAFGTQVQEASLVEGRFRARNLEVAAQFLTIGLNSAKDAANQKANKDKIKVAQKRAEGGSNATQNNFFIGDRNDLLKELAKVEKKQAKVINPPEEN